MKIAIVDDDLKWCEKIKEEIGRSEQGNEATIDFFSCGEDYLASEELYDISFVDIEMPGVDGFETIAKMQKRNADGIYIILTRHNEMSRIGYRVNAFRFIDKLQLDEIKEAIDSAKIVLERNKRIEVNVIGDGVQKITLKDIIFVETEKHYVLLHARQGILKCSNNMKEIEDMLPSKWFCRCHNAFIVNLDEITHIDDRIVYLSNGSDIDISHRKMAQFKKIYLDRQFGCANA